MNFRIYNDKNLYQNIVINNQGGGGGSKGDPGVGIHSTVDNNNGTFTLTYTDSTTFTTTNLTGPPGLKGDQGVQAAQERLHRRLRGRGRLGPAHPQGPRLAPAVLSGSQRGRLPGHRPSGRPPPWGPALLGL